jgi:hypothetical protein
VENQLVLQREHLDTASAVSVQQLTHKQALSSITVSVMQADSSQQVKKQATHLVLSHSMLMEMDGSSHVLE